MPQIRMKRLLVAQADTRKWTPPLRAPLAIAVVRPADRHAPIALVFKLTLAFNENRPDVVATVVEPIPPSGPVPSELHEDRLAYPGDFILPKDACDILLHGHLHAPEPRRKHEGRIIVGGLDAQLIAEQRHPLDAVAISDATPVGTAGAAAPHMQLPQLRADSSIELYGLSPRFPARTVTLPGLLPVAFYETVRQQIEPLALHCDTLWLDTDFERICLVWRGQLPDGVRDRDIDKLMVGLQTMHAEPSFSQLSPRLARSACSFAIEEHDDHVPAPDPLQLEVARHELIEHLAEPEHTLAQYAVISAALAEQDMPRAEVLERYHQDERSWTIEERAWLERQRVAAERGESQLLEEYAELFQRARHSLMKPHEPRGLTQYAAAMVALEGSDEPSKTLAEHDMCMGEWMRLDRHWQQQAAADAQVGEELRQAVKRARDAAAVDEQANTKGSAS